ncbi:hypothetical protein OHB26_38010 [Nocardia sp. NBC_01503]|uniref:hypothetical protein n=1 Tax=Nocardia sp. NBC_01503 TaxID=2975997 RepID=UPI002E7BE940|nr:hypothetical protein [Nocardia sp. NBC_01503]WTL32577.1 hypothetical protein OHB26_38010 [Nocardia sp. NBC_01503]
MATVAVEALSAGDTISFESEPALVQSLLRHNMQKGEHTYDLKLKVLSSGVTVGRSYRAGTEIELIPVEIKPVTLASTIERICTFVDPDGSLYELDVADFQPALRDMYEGTPEVFDLNLLNGEAVTIRPARQ